MRIIRAARRKSFTIMANNVIDDGRLSYRALGLLTYLLSKPDGWETDSNRLSDGRKEGRDATRKAMSELQSAGYLTHQRVQDEGTGRWSTVAHLTDQPGRSTEDGFSVLGATSGNSTKPQVSPKTGFQSSARPAETGIVAGQPEDGFSGAISKNELPSTQELSGGSPAPSPPATRSTKSVDRTEQHDPLSAVPDLNGSGQVTSRTRTRDMNRPILAIVDPERDYDVDVEQLTLIADVPEPRADPARDELWPVLAAQLQRINSHPTSTGATA